VCRFSTPNFGYFGRVIKIQFKIKISNVYIPFTANFKLPNRKCPNALFCLFSPHKNFRLWWRHKKSVFCTMRGIEMRFSKKSFYKFSKLIESVIYFLNFEKIFIFEPTGAKNVLFSLIFWSANWSPFKKYFE
jgi:hypothetical protein